MHFTSYGQLQLHVPVNDTVSHFRISARQFTGTFVTPADARENIQMIPLNFYAQHLGFFCRQELKMERVHVPVAFRVGTMDQCNYLEQKPGYKIY